MRTAGVVAMGIGTGGIGAQAGIAIGTEGAGAVIAIDHVTAGAGRDCTIFRSPRVAQNLVVPLIVPAFRSRERQWERRRSRSRDRDRRRQKRSRSREKRSRSRDRHKEKRRSRSRDGDMKQDGRMQGMGMTAAQLSTMLCEIWRYMLLL